MPTEVRLNILENLLVKEIPPHHQKLRSEAAVYKTRRSTANHSTETAISSSTQSRDGLQTSSAAQHRDPSTIQRIFKVAHEKGLQHKPAICLSSQVLRVCSQLLVEGLPLLYETNMFPLEFFRSTSWWLDTFCSCYPRHSREALSDCPKVPRYQFKDLPVIPQHSFGRICHLTVAAEKVAMFLTGWTFNMKLRNIQSNEPPSFSSLVWIPRVTYDTLTLSFATFHDFKLRCEYSSGPRVQRIEEFANRSARERVIVDVFRTLECLGSGLEEVHGFEGGADGPVLLSKPYVKISPDCRAERIDVDALESRLRNEDREIEAWYNEDRK
ncbi:MAG: hypothetical protein Q9160_006573 [Pyrenula sp. 1 TL-2023]